MNRWKIPAVLERMTIERDRNCVYCGTSFHGTAASRSARPSWEHIVNDARIVTAENIALCCIACNASKGAKDLTVWLETKYCMSRDITERTVAAVVQAALARRRHQLPVASNKPFQPTRAAGPNGQREAAGSGPRG